MDAIIAPKVTIGLHVYPSIGGILATALAIALLSSRGVHGESVDLSAKAVAGLRQVNVDVELKGVLLHQPSGKRVEQLPILAKGRLAYEERLADTLALRYYHAAEATIAVAKGGVTPTLDVRRRLIAVDLSTPRPTLYSPAGPLTRSQLELIDVQGNSALIHRLLPGRIVAVGERWLPTPAALAALLSLDAVYQSDVAGTLARVEKGVAVLEFSGELSGSAGGVPSDLTLNAACAFHVAERRVASLSMAIDEQRGIGPAEPGFEVSARVEVTINPLEKSEVLADAALAQAARSRGESRLIAYASQSAGLQLVHSRRWRTLFENEDTAVLRLIENGNVLAQCNLHRLTDVEADKLPSLEQFQADVQKSLGELFGTFQSADADVTPGGLRRLRVTVSGIVSEVPIRWHYYHLSDGAGRQASCIFTLQPSQLEQLGEEDLQISSTIALEHRPQAPRATGTPEPAGPRTSRAP